MKSIVIQAAVAASLLAQPAGGQELLTTGVLLRDCQGSADLGIAGFCSGYILGLVDGHGLYRDEVDIPVFCPPPRGLAGRQASAIFVQWAERHPEIWHTHAAFGLLSALAEAFPCN